MTFYPHSNAPSSSSSSSSSTSSSSHRNPSSSAMLASSSRYCWLTVCAVGHTWSVPYRTVTASGEPATLRLKPVWSPSPAGRGPLSPPCYVSLLLCCSLRPRRNEKTKTTPVTAVGFISWGCVHGQERIQKDVDIVLQRCKAEKDCPFSGELHSSLRPPGSAALHVGSVSAWCRCPHTRRPPRPAEILIIKQHNTWAPLTNTCVSWGRIGPWHVFTSA